MIHKAIAGVIAACVLVMSAGCNVTGLLGSPTAHEKKVPAEYKLGGTTSRVMVFVDEARGGSVPVELRSQVDAALRNSLIKKVRIRKENLIDSVDYAPSRLAPYARLSPAQIGSNLGADLVVYVRIESHDIQQLHSAGYFSASIVTGSVLVDVASGDVVWPAGKDVKIAKIRLELETKGREATIDRLAQETAHCVTRYFYDCPGDQFRSGSEQREYEDMYWH
ncbi:MAG: hypothetical protein IH624_11900 [Phycisphaerae bacterium]|nr:hypothetical protein [Phycisphaerae bacterium]